MSSTDDPPSAPPASSVLGVAVPVALGVLFGAGVGILLGRTVFAPKPPPAATLGYTATAGMNGPVLPGGALADDGMHVGPIGTPPTGPIDARRFAEAVAPGPIDWARIPEADAYAQSVVAWVREASIDPHAPPPPGLPTSRAVRSAGAIGKSPPAAAKMSSGKSTSWRKMPLPPRTPTKASEPTGTPGPWGGSPTTVDELLRTCPTYDEMLQIRRDFNVTFAVDPRQTYTFPQWACTPGGDESSAELTLYNMFRAAKFLRFDAPIPVIGATNLYDYLQSLQLRTIWIIHNPGQGSFARDGEDRSVHLSDVALGSPDKRFWVEPQSGAGLGDALGLLLHESRHAVGYPHDCGVRLYGGDSSLAYGGAWAVQYWYYRWLAEHTGDQLSTYEREMAAGAADSVRQVRFCDDGTAVLRPDQIVGLRK